MTLRRRRALAVLSGLLLWLSFPHPWALGFEAWPGYLALVALVPLLAALDGATDRQGALLGFFCGLACFVPGLFWLTHVQPLGPGAVPAWLALAAWCAAFPALFGALTARGLREQWGQPALWIAALWTLSELLRENLLSGFPWMGLGSSQYRNLALLPLAAATGQAGLHLAVALGNSLFFGAAVQPKLLLGLKRSLGAVVVALALGALALWQGAAQRAWQRGAEAAPQRRVAVIQGAIDLDQAWTQAYRRALMDRYLALSTRSIEQGAQVLLWPESSFPGFFNEDAPEARELKAFAIRHKVGLLVGSTLSEAGAYTNSAVWIDAAGSTASYAKRHLVPFGEYVPFRGVAPLLDLALERFGVVGFSPGQSTASFGDPGFTIKPLICYESVFPSLAREGGQATLLGVLTVDTWYGHSAGPVWHASQAVLRAVEQGTWVARAASTGISLFASPDGRLEQPIALDQPGFAVQAITAPRWTPFMRWGQGPLWVFFILILVIAIGSRKKG